MFSLQGTEISHFLIRYGLFTCFSSFIGLYSRAIFYSRRVIGEVSAGLVLGPTLLGHFFPEIFHWMFLGFCW